MTTDPSTEAARKQARWEWDFNLSPMSSTPVEDLGQRMAEWARTHLAAQEPTMTTDPTPLQERIARALDPSSWRLHDSGTFPPEHQASQAVIRRSMDDAAAVLPIIAAEVRAAQADAWDEGQASGWSKAQEQWQINGAVGVMWKHADTPNPYREQED